MNIEDSIKKLRDLKKIQFDSVHHDDYMRGLYNGMELSLSLVEDREPFFLNSDAEFKESDIENHPEEVIKGNIILTEVKDEH